MVPWARDRVVAEGSESLGVTESAKSVTGAFTAPRVTWGGGDFCHPDLARAGRKPGRNRYRGHHQRVEV